MTSSPTPVPAAIPAIVAGLLTEGTAAAGAELSALLRRAVTVTIAPAPPEAAPAPALPPAIAAPSRSAAPPPKAALQVAFEFNAREEPPDHTPPIAGAASPTDASSPSPPPFPSASPMPGVSPGLSTTGLAPRGGGRIQLDFDGPSSAALAAALPGRTLEDDAPDATEQAALLEIGSVLLGELLEPFVRRLGFSAVCSLPRLRSTTGPDPGLPATAFPGMSQGSVSAATLALTLGLGPHTVRGRVVILAGAEQWASWQFRLAGRDEKAAA